VGLLTRNTQEEAGAEEEEEEEEANSRPSTKGSNKESDGVSCVHGHL
jgi:hypothetical protein